MPRTEQPVTFGWNDAKERANRRKHGVSFGEAATALCDVLALTGHDPDHSAEEDRFISFGISTSNRLLVVAHTERHGVTRIISARCATKQERKLYEEG